MKLQCPMEDTGQIETTTYTPYRAPMNMGELRDVFVGILF